MKLKKIQHKVSSRTVITNIINSIQVYFDVNSTPFNSILSLTNQIYSTGEYNFLPIYIDNDEEITDDKYDLIIAGKFIHYFSPYIYMLKHIENDLSIKGLKTTTFFLAYSIRLILLINSSDLPANIGPQITSIHPNLLLNSIILYLLTH